MAEAARIGIYLRLRPPRRSAGRVAVDAEGRTVEFNVPKDAAQGWVRPGGRAGSWALGSGPAALA